MSLLLDLSHSRGGIDHVERRLDSSLFEADGDEFRVVAPVVLVADAKKDGKKVRFTGAVTTTIECVCSRCVEPFASEIDAKFDLIFVPFVEGATDGSKEKEVADDDLGVSFYKDDVIDLGEVVREQLYLSLPMKPLCRADCRGLCVTCGVNQNRETCTCRETWVDPRFEVLKRLKTQ